MKAEALGLVAIAMLAAGCGSASSGSQAYGWPQFRDDYPELTSACDVSQKTDVDKVVCWGIKGAKVKSARISAESLPVGKARSDLLAALDSYGAAIDRFDNLKCSATSIHAMPCLKAAHDVGFYDDSIQLTIRKAEEPQ